MGAEWAWPVGVLRPVVGPGGRLSAPSVPWWVGWGWQRTGRAVGRLWTECFCFSQFGVWYWLWIPALDPNSAPQPPQEATQTKCICNLLTHSCLLCLLILFLPALREKGVLQLHLCAPQGTKAGSGLSPMLTREGGLPCEEVHLANLHRTPSCREASGGCLDTDPQHPFPEPSLASTGHPGQPRQTHSLSP